MFKSETELSLHGKIEKNNVFLPLTCSVSVFWCDTSKDIVKKTNFLHFHIIFGKITKNEKKKRPKTGGFVVNPLL